MREKKAKAGGCVVSTFIARFLTDAARVKRADEPNELPIVSIDGCLRLTIPVSGR
ncbi:MAG: hypothetical protein OXI01_16490 [Albidovulum sp.]|nr:hypothetical protein [Albidovulum sp.]